MLPSVTKAKYVRDYLIEVKFNDGTKVPQIPRRFLVVEDFGTRGLEGDTLLSGSEGQVRGSEGQA